MEFTRAQDDNKCCEEKEEAVKDSGDGLRPFKVRHRLQQRVLAT